MILAKTGVQETQLVSPSPPIEDKWVLTHDQGLTFALFVAGCLFACIGYLFKVDIDNKKDIDKQLSENKEASDKQYNDIKDKLQTKVESLTDSINTLSNVTSHIGNKMDIFISKAVELEHKLDKHEETITKKLEISDKRVDVLERQNLVLLNYLQKCMRMSAMNESALVDIQSFLERALVETIGNVGADGYYDSVPVKSRYVKEKPYISTERAEDIKSLAFDYNVCRVSLYTQVNSLQEES